MFTYSQAIAESLVLAANSDTLRTCALRPSMVFGPGDLQVIPAIHACIAARQTPFITGSGTNLYDFTYISNVADAHVLAVENLLNLSLLENGFATSSQISAKDGQPFASGAGQAFFISNGEPVPFAAFCLAVWKQFGHVPAVRVRIPQGLAYRGAVKDACGIRYANLKKARHVLGSRPKVGLEEGIKLACRDYTMRLGLDEDVDPGSRSGTTDADLVE
ncbi:hypothetical protein H2201_000975 [Coniosporium apollinis]|uniref:3-beta hydroxysteroid dehydrogenase/isomerase domain-containing protein n=2 Tax=Coniosporium TaxID=2810619 RepID=A0ABQ9P299_9PEZI|nr:hypothetical protein H2199_003236 [Cladosporium sp. JES 115]KAJ9668731.1 hypothetical protein H2201_000975 [Coniosporium apollinis]